MTPRERAFCFILISAAFLSMLAIFWQDRLAYPEENAVGQDAWGNVWEFKPEPTPSEARTFVKFGNPQHSKYGWEGAHVFSLDDIVHLRFYYLNTDADTLSAYDSICRVQFRNGYSVHMTGWAAQEAWEYFTCRASNIHPAQ